MFKTKFIISSLVFITLLIITSSIKNETRVIEKKIVILNTKIFSKQKNINEAQLDFYYLTSPLQLEKKLNIIGFNNYQPIEFSKIYFDILNFSNFKNKISDLKN